jgi:putative flippase GtrA
LNTSSNRELELSFVAVLIVAAGYIVYEAFGHPGGSDPIGHIAGIAGMSMMLMTETLYTFRKRLRWLRLGRLRAWLSFHIFTGIVGPALVLGHTAFEFNGLAGLSMLMTVVVVGSGFVGRYLYTAIPRTRAGAEMSLTQVASQEQDVQQQIDHFMAERSARVQTLMQTDAAHRTEVERATMRSVLSRALIDWQYRRDLNRQLRHLDRTERQHMNELSRLLRRRRELERQIATLQSAHRLMSAWHTVHVPLGVTLFLSAFLHVFGTLYYGAVKLF